MSRRRLALRLSMTVLALLVATAVAASAAEGFDLRGVDGERLSEGDVSRGATVVVVWATWSPKSRDVVERVNRIADRWQGSARVVTVTFQEERSAVVSFLGGKGLRVPVFLDGDGVFSRRYSIATLPGLLVLKDGQVAYRGKLPDDPDVVIGESLR